MNIIRITLKEGGDTKVILLRMEEQNAYKKHALEPEKTSAGKRKERLPR